MKKMQDLDLSGNKIVGQFPLCLTRLTGLQVLDLSSNQLNGNVPSALGKLESLKYLSLFDNHCLITTLKAPSHLIRLPTSQS